MTDHRLKALLALEGADKLKSDDIMQAMYLTAVAAVHAQLEVAEEIGALREALS